MSQPQPYDIMIIHPASDGKVAHFTGEIPNDLWAMLLGMILDKIKAINRFAGLIDRLGAGQVNISLK